MLTKQQNFGTYNEERRLREFNADTSKAREAKESNEYPTWQLRREGRIIK